MKLQLSFVVEKLLCVYMYVFRKMFQGENGRRDAESTFNLSKHVVFCAFRDFFNKSPALQQENHA
jgi:hypothetical protein